MQWMEKAQTTTNKLQGYVSASGQPQVAWRTAVRVSYRRFTDKEACERITDFTYLSFMVDGYRDVSTSDCEDARTKGRDSDWCVHMTTSKNLSYFVAQSVVISLKFSVIWVIIHWEQAYFIPKHVFLNLTECFSCWNPSRHWQKTEKKQRVDSVIIGPKQDVITCLLM